ncbi:hypothetical protein CcI49_13455 [Frankia sp. CcI49]|uniref:class I SAM-dependent methyltransferase n=1 Tax=Frankia sp. CcI49 TaxID=1745382 RepID=UPI000976D0FB|nr:class I SAM-dependent methyltransferase [Frankia sp. CcI49]ONH59758.1 hypothetical protein CcI49_13455 [Frankia sp. CcI49]
MPSSGTSGTTSAPAPATASSYSSRVVAVGYDVLNGLLWLPGGSRGLRRRFVDDIGMSGGMRVLELGCGSGLVTRHLVARGAAVTAIDAAEPMLARARRRASGAAFATADLLAADALPAGPFDRIVLAFVLHELDAESRARVLTSARERLAADGLIGILEWGLPTSGPAAAVWRTVVRRIEPPVAHDMLTGGLDGALERSMLRTVSDRRYAGGRARGIAVTPHRVPTADARISGTGAVAAMAAPPTRLEIA